MLDSTLEEVIRRYVPLQAQPNSKGWFSVLCKVCNDHGKKGMRAAFLFEAPAVGYHCFNCSHTAKYNPTENDQMPVNMKKVLHDFGIPDDEWKPVLLSAMALNINGIKKKEQKTIYTAIEPNEIELPKSFYPLGNAESVDKWTIIARDYLVETRGVDPDKYPFFVTSDTGRWKGRLIIPVYKDNKLIFYQGRALTKRVKKYLSPDIPKDNIIYGFEKIFEYTDAPIYIVEGWFDAEAIDGIATFGNILTDAQVLWLNRSNRRKIVIPDREGDGRLLADKAIELNWEVSFPDIGNCKDMSEAKMKYGRMYLMKTIVDNTKDGFAAQAQVGLYCKK